MQHLTPNATLQDGKYRIMNTLGQGGFGITYLAENVMLDGKVAIKEFFYKEHCNRDESTSHVTVPTEVNLEIVDRFKQKFVKEARTLFKLSHPNIVRILDIFEENNTAYYVMEYIEGESLSSMVKRRGAINEAEAIEYIKKVGDALSYIHSKNMNHLDIKPANIMKRSKDGQILLIDFGVAKQYDTNNGEGTTTTPVGISHGYSPMEQYQRNGVQSFSPQSDVYALAATLYTLLTGKTPPEAMMVQDEGLPKTALLEKSISPSVINAIEAAMRTRSLRTQSINAFLESLEAEASPADDDDGDTVLSDKTIKAEEERRKKEKEAKAEAERKNKKQKKQNKSDDNSDTPSQNKKWIMIAAGLIVVAGIVIGITMMGGSSDNASEEAQKEVQVENANEPKTVQNATIVLTKGHESKRNFKYTGEVDNEGLPHGKGKAEYPETKSSGSCSFEGTFEHGITSNGTMRFTNGSKYEGSFDSEGAYNEGTWTEKDGFYFKGTFKNGDPFNGTWYTPTGQEDQKLANGK